MPLRRHVRPHALDVRHPKPLVARGRPRAPAEPPRGQARPDPGGAAARDARRRGRRLPGPRQFFGGIDTPVGPRRRALVALGWQFARDAAASPRRCCSGGSTRDGGHRRLPDPAASRRRRASSWRCASPASTRARWPSAARSPRSILGLAAQQTLGNLFAGTVLLSARPFRVGERVRLQGGGLAGKLEGVVSSLGLLYTTFAAGRGPDHGPQHRRAERRGRPAARARRRRPARAPARRASRRSNPAAAREARRRRRCATARVAPRGDRRRRGRRAHHRRAR